VFSRRLTFQILFPRLRTPDSPALWCTVKSVLFTLWLPEGSETEDEMVVTGTLKIIQHAPSQINPMGFTEYRLVGESR
jgi:hypothetical protein